MDVVDDIITIVICVILLVTLVLPKKIRYGVFAAFLFILGGIPLLYLMGLIGITFAEAPIIKYVTTFVVVLAGRSLFMEGVKMESEFKWAAISLGVIIIILTTIPSLHAAKALSFGLPEFPELINHILYIISGGCLIAGIFFISE